MKHFIVALTIGFLAACATPAPPAAAEARSVAVKPIPLGTSYTLQSEILGDTREINIWAPPGFEESRAPGAILYVLDGALDQDFKHIAGLGELCALSWTCETTIIVGIQTKDRQHELTPAATDPRFVKGFPQAGGASDFRRFIAEEVRPFVEKRYDPAPRSAVMGESLAGLFVVDTLLEAPTLFDDYIAISPSLWWDAGRVSAGAPAKLAAPAVSGRRLYMAMANEGGTMEQGIAALRAAIASAAPQGFSLTFSDRSATETHATIYHAAALDALRTLYAMPPWEGETPWWMSADGAP
jgi:predicted alpha/beta superfamily hydrolase